MISQKHVILLPNLHKSSALQIKNDFSKACNLVAPGVDRAPAWPAGSSRGGGGDGGHVTGETETSGADDLVTAGTAQGSQTLTLTSMLCWGLINMRPDHPFLNIHNLSLG